jgi:hypothetical protein
MSDVYWNHDVFSNDLSQYEAGDYDIVITNHSNVLLEGWVTVE